MSNVIDTADVQRPPAMSYQSDRCRRHCSDLPEDDIPRPRKLFFEDSARHPGVVAVLMAGASTSPSTTHDVPVVEVIDDGALTIPPGYLPIQDDTSGL